MKTMTNLLLALVALISYCCGEPDSEPQKESGITTTEINIDAGSRISKTPEKPGGVVACWLMDSDMERPRDISFVDAMKDMGVKYIRFPYGHLADNYLWDADGDWGNKLTPKAAASTQAPANWDWAVDKTTGEFIKDMDFDEYIDICNQAGAEPMVVVNILSYKYNGGPTYEQLKESAVEWVRYANIVKGYHVKRWALGNEIDHHGDLISLDEYKKLYADFAQAMKAVDPGIWVGPGLLGNWFDAMLKVSPDLIDFVCAHNYLYKYSWRNENYEGWKSAADILVNNVEKCQNAVKLSPVPDIEIHVTEMNSRPWKDNSDNDDLFRALAYGEMVLNSCTFQNVKATYAWNTHGPWNGPEENAPYNILDLKNNREPRGDLIKLINENLLNYFVDVKRVNGYIRSYATVNETGDRLSVFLINKNDAHEKVKLTGFNFSSQFSLIKYTGSDPYDESPEMDYSTEVLKVDGTLELSPVSFNVLKFEL